MFLFCNKTFVLSTMKLSENWPKIKSLTFLDQILMRALYMKVSQNSLASIISFIKTLVKM